MIRCVNIDWLELYCLEDPCEPLSPDHLREASEMIVEREYGTRVYQQMFTVHDEHGDPMLEVRRQPASSMSAGGVLPQNACHIRLVNRYCYCSNPCEVLRNFCRKYNVTIHRISRVDICLDFERFDTGDDPQRFIHRYIKGKYTKINQANVHAHGTDTWEKRLWNSLSWGSKQSPISTKIYNKTQELEEVKDKPYIRQAWFETQLVDNPIDLTKKRRDGQMYKPVIWRLEFSIKSDVRNWVTIERDGNHKQYQSLRNTLEVYDSREKLLVMIASLQAHYFHFKHYHYGRSKYECEDKLLFRFDTNSTYYQVEHPSSAQPKQNAVLRLLRYLRNYKLTIVETDVRSSIETIIKHLENQDTARLLANPYSKVQLVALQQAIAARLGGSQQDPAKLLNQIAEEVHAEVDKPFL